MDGYGRLCIVMGIYGSLWVCVGVSGRLWEPMGVYEYLVFDCM